MPKSYLKHEEILNSFFEATRIINPRFQEAFYNVDVNEKIKAKAADLLTSIDALRSVLDTMTNAAQAIIDTEIVDKTKKVNISSAEESEVDAQVSAAPAAKSKK